MRAPIRTGKLVVDVETKTVELEGQPLRLAGKEYAIFELLILHKGTVVRKELLTQRLYEQVDERKLKTARVILHTMRKKLAHARDGQYYIETVGGRGHMLRDLVE